MLIALRGSSAQNAAQPLFAAGYKSVTRYNNKGDFAEAVRDYLKSTAGTKKGGLFFFSLPDIEDELTAKLQFPDAVFLISTDKEEGITSAVNTRFTTWCKERKAQAIEQHPKMVEEGRSIWNNGMRKAADYSAERWADMVVYNEHSTVRQRITREELKKAVGEPVVKAEPKKRRVQEAVTPDVTFSKDEIVTYTGLFRKNVPARVIKTTDKTVTIELLHYWMKQPDGPEYNVRYEGMSSPEHTVFLERAPGTKPITIRWSNRWARWDNLDKGVVLSEFHYWD